MSLFHFPILIPLSLESLYCCQGHWRWDDLPTGGLRARSPHPPLPRRTRSCDFIVFFSFPLVQSGAAPYKWAPLPGLYWWHDYDPLSSEMLKRSARLYGNQNSLGQRPKLRNGEFGEYELFLSLIALAINTSLISNCSITSSTSVVVSARSSPG